MTNENDVKKIAKMLTDDPDIFNEMALGTGAIAMPPGGNIKRSKKQRAAEDDDVGTHAVWSARGAAVDS